MPVYETKHKDYPGYCEQQGKKIKSKFNRFIKSDPARIRKFQHLFRHVVPHLNNGKVLCLGARTGAEVVAFRNLGFKNSIGVDLFPAGDLVIEDDWHNMRFPDNVFPNAYTNAIDHCYDLEKMTKEVARVLRPGGMFIIALSNKQMMCNKKDKDEYMSKSANFLFWDHPNDLIQDICRYGGFILEDQWKPSHSWQYFALKLGE